MNPPEWHQFKPLDIIYENRNNKQVHYNKQAYYFLGYSNNQPCDYGILEHNLDIYSGINIKIYKKLVPGDLVKINVPAKFPKVIYDFWSKDMDGFVNGEFVVNSIGSRELMNRQGQATTKSVVYLKNQDDKRLDLHFFVPEWLQVSTAAVVAKELSPEEEFKRQRDENLRSMFC